MTWTKTRFVIEIKNDFKPDGSLALITHLFSFTNFFFAHTTTMGKELSAEIFFLDRCVFLAPRFGPGGGGGGGGGGGFGCDRVMGGSW